MRLLKKTLSSVNNLLTRFLVCLIKVYRFLVSPFLGQNCRFHPSCSEYATDAILKKGALIGVYLVIRRLLKCHPWHPGGLDPVPSKHINKNSHPQTEF